MARATRKRLGEILIDQGLIQEEHLVAALQEQKRTGELLGETLVRLNYATEDDIASTIVIQFGLPFLPVKRYRINDDVKMLFPPRLLKRADVQSRIADGVIQFVQFRREAPPEDITLAGGERWFIHKSLIQPGDHFGAIGHGASDGCHMRAVSLRQERCDLGRHFECSTHVGHLTGIELAYSQSSR